MGNKFLTIYDEYYDAIYRYVRAKVGSKWDAEDIVSEVFRKAFENFSSIKSNTKAWLFSTARNSINDFYRKNKNRTVELEDIFCSEQSHFEDELVKVEDFKCLKSSLASLEDEEYDLITMRFFSDMKYEEIEKVLGKQSSYLRVKVSRTIKKIGTLVMKCLEG